jgi:transketolase
VPYLEQLSNSHHLRLTDEVKAALNETIRHLEASHD